MTDLYAVLELTSRATEAEIKAAYRRLAKETHPDRHPGQRDKEVRFKQIAAAYEVLGDSEKRARYDQDLVTARKLAAEAEARKIANDRAAAWAAAWSPPAPVIVAPPTRPAWIDLLGSVLKIGLGIAVAVEARERHGTRWDRRVQRRRGSDGRFRRS